jgi:glycerophosphoryl diester phosphodiesterase
MEDNTANSKEIEKSASKKKATNSKTKKTSKKSSIAKKEVNKSKNDSKNFEQKVEPKVEYFGHKENEEIWGSFLTEKMFAHKGLHNKTVPENSLTAFKLAIENGYGIELDINPIEDGTPVVFHDSKMSRMTGKDKYIQNLSKEELEATTLLNSTEKIPTLEEVLKLVNGKTPLLIEIKHQQKVGDLEKRIWELLKNYKGEYAIQSFDPFTLKWFYDNAPKVWRGQLSSYFKGEDMGFVKKSVLKRLGLRKITHQNFVSYDISNLPNRYVKKLEIPLIAWTVRNQESYIKSVQITDNVIFEGFEPRI